MKQNPKLIQALKDGKAPLEYLVPTMDELDAAVHKHGADKYGKFNWRIDEILASTYVGAMRRHLKAWVSGEDIDPESGKPHLTHLRACCAVVLDAAMHDKLIDDRLLAESKSVKAAAAEAPPPPPAPLPKRVRVTKAALPTYWYASRIGQEFDVNGACQLPDGLNFEVASNFGVIAESDCVPVVAQPPDEDQVQCGGCGDYRRRYHTCKNGCNGQ